MRQRRAPSVSSVSSFARGRQLRVTRGKLFGRGTLAISTRLAFAVALLIPVLAACSGSRCAHVACFQFQACDSSDGLCKCAGAVCPIGESCDGTRCVGALGGAGDAGDGGDAGDAGDAGGAGDGGDAGCELPDSGDDCPGMTCLPGTLCSRADGLCHCGRRDGPVCKGNSRCEVYLAGDGCAVGPLRW